LVEKIISFQFMRASLEVPKMMVFGFYFCKFNGLFWSIHHQFNPNPFIFPP